MPALDALALGARLAQLLATGRRVSTYKLATLSALVQHCLENPVADDAAAHVPIPGLADRVVEAYWPQVRAFGEIGLLRQNEQAGAGVRTVVDTVRHLRTLAEQRGLGTPAQLRTAEPDLWRRTRRALAVVLAQQPLFALQRSGGRAPGTAFLYDDSWLSKKVTVATLDAHAWSIELLPGVSTALRRLSPVLQPVVQQWWVDDVQRMNRAELDVPDLHGFLFGAERTAVARLAPGLREHQSGRCFYCAQRLPADVHVDHVLPWSRVALDGVRNLVVADPRCNGDKLAALPALEHVQAVLARPEDDLAQIAAPLRWPVESERVRATARSLYASAPAGTPLWRRAGVYDFLGAGPLPF
ncbi:HNH endonuclease [Kineococcus sp. T13]|uniref:HNH endonuclease domain-containing protein n=1 Tax=Kineococcus vitellinus TaxID=2696565 RepID=UPI0014122299|nr:HNH endonuclease [Kineococcus vitellinus]